MVVRMDCLFCKIANKEEEANILYEDDLVVMILDAYPTVDGHCLIIPKKHYETYLDIPDDLWIIFILINPSSKGINLFPFKVALELSKL